MARCGPWQAVAITFHLKGVSISIAGACIRFGRAGSGSDFDTDQSRNVYLVPLIAFASLTWHGAVSKACEKVPALAQLKKWSFGDPLMSKLAACGTSLWSSATFVVGSAVSSRNIRA